MIYEYLACNYSCPFAAFKHCDGDACMAWVESETNANIGYCKLIGNTEIEATTNKTIEEKEVRHDA